MTPLRRRFFEKDTAVVARALLGHVLEHRVGDSVRAGRIVETEAYLGPHDLACHSAKGRTARTEVMFGPAGVSYVFLVYGMHHCFNVVTGGGAAVLIRALEPLTDGLKTNGPGRLTKALGLTTTHNGLSLDEGAVRLIRGRSIDARFVTTTPRIGVDYAGEWAKAPLRFFDARSEWVSAKK